MWNGNDRIENYRFCLFCPRSVRGADTVVRWAGQVPGLRERVPPRGHHRRRLLRLPRPRLQVPGAVPM